jgi:hypothetical protein
MVPAAPPSTAQPEAAKPATEVAAAPANAAKPREPEARASARAPSTRNESSKPPAAADTTAPPVLQVAPRGTLTPSETPTRQEVLDALEPLRPEIQRCAQGQHGIAQLDITVVSSGAVTHAVVGGDFSGTAAGSCMALAARGAKFAPFQKPRFRVIFPFSL